MGDVAPVERPEDWNPNLQRQRDLAFDAWLMTQKEFYLLPASKQDVVRHMLKKSFHAGSNWQRMRQRQQREGKLP